MAQNRIVIPNECEGSKISPCGRNDRDDLFDVATQSPEGEGRRQSFEFTKTSPVNIKNIRVLSRAGGSTTDSTPAPLA